MILYYVRRPSEFVALAKLQSSLEAVAVASDDIDVIALAKNAGVAEVMYFTELKHMTQDQKESVFAIIDEVNTWLKSQFGAYISPYVLRWNKHIEGDAGAAVTILQAMMVVESLELIFYKLKITKIVFWASVSTKRLDSIVVEFSRFKGIPCECIEDFWSKWVGSLKMDRFGKKLFGKISLALPVWCMGIIRHCRLVVRMLVVSLKKEPKLVSTKPAVGFSQFGHTLRHLEQIVPVASEFMKRGFHTAVLSWSMTESYAFPKGVQVIKLEDSLSFLGVVKTVAVYFRFRLSLMGSKRCFFQTPQTYHGVLFTSLLWEIVEETYRLPFLDLMLMQGGVRSFFQKNTFKAVKLWGETILPMGIIVANVLKRELIDRPLPVLFECPIGITLGRDSEIHEDLELMDLRFVSGFTEMKNMKESKVPYKVFVSGLIQQAPHTQNIVLDRGPSKRLTLVYISCNVSTGTFSALESALVLDMLGHFARTHPSVDLIVKLHPCEDPKIAQYSYSKHGMPSNFSIIAEGLAYPIMARGDLIVSKFSTCILEAVGMKKPVVSIVLDGGANIYKALFYGERMDMFSDLDAFGEFLDHIFLNPEKFQSWCDAQRDAVQAFFQESLCGVEAVPSVLIAEQLIQEMASNFR